MGTCASSPAEAGPRPASKGWEMTPEVVPAYEAAQGPFFVNRVEDKREIVFAKEGPGSRAAAPPDTFSSLLRKAAEACGAKPALCVELPVPPLGPNGVAPPALPIDQWKTWSWQQFYDDSRTVAKAYVALGAKRFDGSVIYGLNSPYWVLSFTGAILAGALPAGIYPTDTPDQIQFKSDYTNAVIAFCDDEKHYEVFTSMAASLPLLKAIVAWGFDPKESEIARDGAEPVRIFNWNSFTALGSSVTDEQLDAGIAAQDPRECAAFVFTSGTTGRPKAVMLSHDNLKFTAHVTMDPIKDFGIGGQERILSYLPLSHVAGVNVDILLPVQTSAKGESHVTVFFARPYDLKSGSLGQRLQAVRPTAFLGVPRVWEKIAEKIRAAGASTKGLKKKIATFAKQKGYEYQQNCQLGGSGVKPAMYNTVNDKILMKIKTVLGLDACKLAITGAAPMSRELQEYFASLGISINDVYGMSECGGGTTGNNNECRLWGSVGQAFPGTEVRVFKVDDKDVNIKTECPRTTNPSDPTEEEQGELCYRGRHIMMGYYANPRLGEEHVTEIETKNAETIDGDGYLHSGDKGTCSSVNMFYITGRYKELIIGVGGENIAPVPVEDFIKAKAAGVSNFIMIGDKRKFNTALVTLRAAGATGELPGGDDLDPAVHGIGSPGVTKISQAVNDEKWIKHIQDAIAECNKSSVCHNNAWKIQKFTILPHDLSVEGLELTPTLKTKRSYVDNKYKEVIDHMYNSESTYVKCPLFDSAAAPAAATNATAATPQQTEGGEPSDATSSSPAPTTTAKLEEVNPTIAAEGAPAVATTTASS
eukprot:CAMPEP_0202074770 /NCGR_PEP_ID=MMETSP0964-20121228/3815_1 /ASSEMBLY_ACC=CAM_ASM_000500 /TAXON_ID=4773 /ORGANISM="Schizochytrium aggregatum, Strain ATCC28209" /LENGTH=815 /DNA_ID=CAMNT_0048641939 /DNA_START=61 /DNA_END=2508 /DNA_ORIENTATION=+